MSLKIVWVTVVKIMIFLVLKKVLESTVIREFKYGAPDMIRTCDRWYRKPVLYPAELRAHTISIKRLKLYRFKLIQL